MKPLVIVCNSRAERGPLQSVMQAVEHVELSCDVSSFTTLHTADAMTSAIRRADSALRHVMPRRVVVLGDRYETLACALAAMFLNIPVAHIHGGETTEGAMDDALRHSISHIADLHFCATYKFANKIISLGKRPETVHVVGAPGLDGVPLNAARRHTNTILVTFHPETRLPDRGAALCKSMLEALREVPSFQVVFTGVNADPGGREIDQMILDYVSETPNAMIMPKLSHNEYIGLMMGAVMVVGNSSAGIIEAPWVGVPTVNIGDRQKGRPCAASVFNWRGLKDGLLYAAFMKAMNFSGECHPIYQGGAAQRIAKVLDVIDGLS